MNSTPLYRPTLILMILSVCLLTLSAGGFIGGIAMLRDPYGAPLGMPVSDLARTPFQNYIAPGILLIVVWGIMSMIALIGLWWQGSVQFLNRLTGWTHEHWAWVLTVVLGVILLVWLTYQVMMLPVTALPQYLLYAFAVLMILLPLIPDVRHYYLISPFRDRYVRQ